MPAAPEAAYAVVADLGTYPQWLGIVHRATAVRTHGPDRGPAWRVDIGSRVGLVRMTKTVRMVRVVDDPGRHARFERGEVDGRHHSAWELDVTVDPTATGSTVAVHLHYGGAGWANLLEPVLRAEAARAARRLASLLA